MNDDTPFEQDIHRRLINGDPVAPDDLASRYLELVRKHVQGNAHRRGVHDEERVNDATMDAIFDYILHTEKFDPQKATLLGYLKFAAVKDLANAISKRLRRSRHEEVTDDVELMVRSRNKLA